MFPMTPPTPVSEIPQLPGACGIINRLSAAFCAGDGCGEADGKGVGDGGGDGKPVVTAAIPEHVSVSDIEPGAAWVTLTVV